MPTEVLQAWYPGAAFAWALETLINSLWYVNVQSSNPHYTHTHTVRLSIMIHVRIISLIFLYDIQFMHSLTQQSVSCLLKIEKLPECCSHLASAKIRDLFILWMVDKQKNNTATHLSGYFSKISGKYRKKIWNFLIKMRVIILWQWSVDLMREKT